MRSTVLIISALAATSALQVCPTLRQRSIDSAFAPLDLYPWVKLNACTCTCAFPVSLQLKSKPTLTQPSAEKALALRGGAFPDFGKANAKCAFCSLGFLGALAATRDIKEGGMLDFALAKKVFTVIYTIFFAQFLLIPTFFFNDNFVDAASSTNPFVLFFMRLFGWCGLTSLYLLLPSAAPEVALKYMAIANAGFCWFGPITAELTHEVCHSCGASPPYATCAIDPTISASFAVCSTLAQVTAKHIVPIVLLPLASALTLATTM